MPVINQLKPAKKRKVIKIYLDTFVRKEVPCKTCVEHCCGGCHSTQGHFDSSFGLGTNITKAHVAKMKELYGWTSWDEKINDMYSKDWLAKDQGFFVAGKGCRIPYKERSAVCIGFTCTRFDRIDQDTAWVVSKELSYGHTGNH